MESWAKEWFQTLFFEFFLGVQMKHMKLKTSKLTVLVERFRSWPRFLVRALSMEGGCGPTGRVDFTWLKYAKKTWRFSRPFHCKQHLSCVFSYRSMRGEQLYISSTSAFYRTYTFLFSNDTSNFVVTESHWRPQIPNLNVQRGHGSPESLLMRFFAR